MYGAASLAKTLNFRGGFRQGNRRTRAELRVRDGNGIVVGSRNLETTGHPEIPAFLVTVPNGAVTAATDITLRELSAATTNDYADFSPISTRAATEAD